MTQDKQKVPESDEKVGYCRPPRATRFKPGQSGNPRGRPRKPKPIQDLLMAELNRRVMIQENGRERKLPKLELVTKRLVNDAIQGEYPALRLLIDLLRVAEKSSDPNLKRSLGELSMEDRDILARYLTAKDPLPDGHGDSGA